MNRRYALLLWCNLCMMPGLIASDLDLSLGNTLQSSITTTWNAISSSTAALAHVAGNAWRNYGKTALTRLTYILALAALAAPIINKLLCYRTEQLARQVAAKIELVDQAKKLAQRNTNEPLTTYIDRLNELRNEYAVRYNYVGWQLLQAKRALSQLIYQDHPVVMAEKQALKNDIMLYTAWQHDLKAALGAVDKKIDEVETFLLKGELTKSLSGN